MIFGKMLKAYRDKFDLSQSEVAEEIGASKPTISRIENGKEVGGSVMVRLLVWMMREER